MDPSSFASATANLLGLTIQVTGSLYGDWDHSSRVLAERLIYELSQLRNVLQSLEVTALSTTEAVIVPKDLLISLEDVKSNLTRLGSRLLRPDALGGFSFRDSELPWRSINAPRPPQATKLPLTPPEALDEVQYLRDFLAKLRKSIEISTFRSSDELAPKRTADPTGTLWRDRAEYTKVHELVRSSRLERTGLWFVTHPVFRRWLVGERVPNALFCPGKPGSGKTVLASLAIDEARKWQQDNISSNIGVAYFYFSYKTPSPLLNVALALLEQLYLQSSSPDDEVKELEALAAKSEHIPFSQIVSVLLAVSRRFQKAYIILDALDECPPDHQHDLVHILTAVRDSPTRLFASSRPHQTFDIFNTSPKIEIVPSREDINLYANAKLGKAPVLVGNEALLDWIISALIDAGVRHQMFLPIVLQVDAILRKTNTEQIMLQFTELPRSLHAVYVGVLNRALEQKPHMAELAKRTLTWLSYSQRPLKTKELLEIHRFFAPDAPEIDVTVVIEACMGLVQAGKTITFAHFSVKEFFEYTPIGDEEIVAHHCVKYLLSSNIDQAKSPESVDDQIQTNPFLLYAASYWGDHVRNTTQKHNKELGCLTRLCLALLNDKSRVASICHIVFMSLPRVGNGVLEQRLVKSSWLHLVSYFGLDWAIEPPAAEITPADERDEWDRTPLQLAAENGFANCVELLLPQISQSLQDSDGRTVWHYAAISGNTETMRLLLASTLTLPDSSRANPSTSLGADKLGEGKSPLEYAAVNGNAKIFSMLLPLYTPEFGDDFKDKAFLSALASSKTDIVECLLSQGEIPNYKHLVVAAKAGFEEGVQLLLDHGTKIDNPDKNGDSALLVAARERRNNILQFLIWNGADLDGVGRDDYTALAWAVEKGNVEGVQILLQAGAMPEGLIKEDRLVVYAARQGMVEIVRQLLDAGAEASGAAFAAVENGHVEVLRLLLKSRLPADMISDSGQSLLEAAREAGHSAVEDLLETFEPNSFPRIVYTVPSGDAVDPKTPWEEDSPSIKDAVSPSELPSSVKPASANESSEQKTPGQKGNSPLTMFTGDPVSEIPRAILPREPQTKEIESKPTPSQILSRSDPKIVRSAGPRGSTVPFFLLSEPISTDNLPLGSIVANPRDPMSDFALRDISKLSWIGEYRSETIQFDYRTIHERRTTNRFALEALRSLLNLESTHERSVAMSSPRVLRQRLHNHELVLSRILHDHPTGGEILDMARSTGRKELYLVVGLLIASDLLALTKQQATTSGSPAFAGQTEVRHSGDKIFAVSYRIVKVRTRRSLRNLATRGSLSDARDVFVDSYFKPEAHETIL